MSITTLYNGIEYRSRLEARWAAFFTRIGWDFTYEPFDGDGYIPDFLIHGPRPLIVEVKPAVTLEDYQAPIAKAERGLRAHWQRDILIVGAAPIARIPTPFGFHDHPTVGLMGEPELSWDDPPRTLGWGWAEAHWITCLECRSTAICHAERTYASRPCGCYEGDHSLGWISKNALQDHWAAACNDVKWRGAAA